MGEAERHTWYILECSLEPSAESPRGGCVLSWCVQLRLFQIRQELHDHVKDALGEAYARHFGATPSAHRGGIYGTKARLHSWCGALAACISAGSLPVDATAHVLRVLQVPQASKSVEVAAPAASCEPSPPYCSSPDSLAPPAVRDVP